MEQLAIVHLSDLHFGDPHFFQPPLPPDGVPAANTMPSLLNLLVADLNSEELRDLTPRFPESSGRGYIDMPLIVAISGDLTQTAGTKEFDQAQQFISDLGNTPVLGSKITSENIFVVPGNHDVIYNEPDIGRRWYPYCRFYERHRGLRIDAAGPQALTRILDRSDKGFIIAELNSCVYVQKDSADAIRGQIDDASLFSLKQALREISGEQLQRSIRIAIVHHHPVVLPALAEPGRGYDAIVNSHALLGLLREFGFHIIVHGHKHYPHTFLYDAKCAWSNARVYPLTVIAGGSVGSRFLPERVANATNVYNFITFKWDPKTALSRIRVVTRGLQTHDPYGGAMLPQEWRFRTLTVEDRVSGSHMADIGVFETLEFKEDDFEKRRRAIYQEFRCNMPVVEVMPSLVPQQEYEARLWIVPHEGRHEIPAKVEWSAGRHFPVVACTRETNAAFCATLAYYGPMLVQARMYFDDGGIATGYVYARLPGKR